MTIDQGALFGRGLAFPPKVRANGRLGWSAGPENIRQTIRIILLTEPGERLMMPEFGGGLARFLFQPNTVTTHRLIEEAIEQALGRWEPRIALRSVLVAEADDDPEAAIATIRYALITSGAEDRLQLRLQLATGA